MFPGNWEFQNKVTPFCLVSFGYTLLHTTLFFFIIVHDLHVLFSPFGSSRFSSPSPSLLLITFAILFFSPMFFMCSYAYIVVVLCTESVVCGLASHTSLGDSPVAYPSFFPLQ
ncbi:unnamed protein product, partial [Brassica rapa]